MTLYKFSIDYKNHITVEALDGFEERPKSYRRKNEYYGYTVVKKDDIDKLPRYGDLYSLSPDTSSFKSRLIKRQEAKIESMTTILDAEAEKLEKLKAALLDGEER